jgi:hypothetical protein
VASPAVLLPEPVRAALAASDATLPSRLLTAVAAAPARFVASCADALAAGHAPASVAAGVSDYLASLASGETQKPSWTLDVGRRPLHCSSRRGALRARSERGALRGRRSADPA